MRPAVYENEIEFVPSLADETVVELPEYEIVHGVLPRPSVTLVRRPLPSQTRVVVIP